MSESECITPHADNVKPIILDQPDCDLLHELSKTFFVYSLEKCFMDQLFSMFVIDWDAYEEINLERTEKGEILHCLSTFAEPV